MYEIELSVVARFRILQLLNDKCKGKALSSDFRKAADLYEKIDIPDEERERKYCKKDREGNFIPDNEAIRSARVEKFQLTFDEFVTLDKVTEDIELMPMERKLWYTWVRNQIQEAKKPTLDDEETKTQRLASRRENSQKGLSVTGS